MTIVVILVAMFLIVSIVPFLQWICYLKETKNQMPINYVFEQQLFELDLDESKYIKYTKTLKPIFDKNDLEQRKQEEIER